MRKSDTQTFKPIESTTIRLEPYSTLSSRCGSFELPDGWTRAPDSGDKHPLHYITPILPSQGFAAHVNKNELLLPAINERLAVITETSLDKQLTPLESPMSVPAAVKQEISIDTSFVMHNTKKTPTISPMSGAAVQKDFSFSYMFSEQAPGGPKIKTKFKLKT